MAEHKSTFNQGMNTDLDAHQLPSTMYRDAVNMELSEEGEMFALKTAAGHSLQWRFPLTADQFINAAYNFDPPNDGTESEYILSSHEVVCKYHDVLKGTNYKAESILIITAFGTAHPTASTLLATTIPYTTNNIYVVDTTTNTIHRLFTADLNMPYNVGIESEERLEVDGYMHTGTRDDYFYWTDNRNVPRRVRLFVKDNRQADCAKPGLSPYDYVTANGGDVNDPDLLSTIRLYPVDELRVFGVEPYKGKLRCGSYQFAYRYYNTNTNTYSKFSLFGNPLPIIPGVTTNDKEFVSESGNTYTSSDDTNTAFGGDPEAITQKAVRLKLTGADSQISTLYNAVQLAVVRNSAGERQPSETVVLLEPSIDFYNNRDFLYTGTESEGIETIDNVVVPDLPVATAKTLTFAKGRLVYGNITYANYRHPTTFADAETHFKHLRTSVDGINAIQIERNAGNNPGGIGEYQREHLGYMAEVNCHRFRGHFRNEVYRYATVYVDRYGNFSEPVPLDFSAITRATPTPDTSTASVNYAGPITAILSHKYFPVDGINDGRVRQWIVLDIDGEPAELLIEGDHSGSPDFDILAGNCTVLAGSYNNSDRFFYGGSLTLAITYNQDIVQLPGGINLERDNPSYNQQYSITNLSLDYAETNARKNWAAAGVTDWKFPPRFDPAGALFSEDGVSYNPDRNGNNVKKSFEYIRAMGLRITGITDHPEWAVGMYVVRMERDRDILVQSPLIHAAAYQGVPTMAKGTTSSKDSGSTMLDALQVKQDNILNTTGWRDNPETRPRPHPDHRVEGLYDYDGREDTFGPRVLSYGQLQHLAAFRSGMTFSTSPGWENENIGAFDYWYSQFYGAGDDGPYFNLFYLYPMEILTQLGLAANDNLLRLDGTEQMVWVDQMALTGFNAVNSGDDKSYNYKWNPEGDEEFRWGWQKEYAWVYSLRNKHAFYYGKKGPEQYHKSFTEAYDFALDPEMQKGGILLKAGFILGLAHQPQTLNSSYFRGGNEWGGDGGITPEHSVDFSKIRRANNEANLIRQQLEAIDAADNSQTWTLPRPQPQNNQACVLTSIESDGLYIPDRSAFFKGSALDAAYPSIYNEGLPIILTPERIDYDGFSVGQLVNPVIYNYVVPSPVGSPPGNWDDNFLGGGRRNDYYQIWRNQYDRRARTPINPIGQTVQQVPVVNIVKGKSDDRYNTVDESQAYINTGTYLRLDTAAPTDTFNVEVFGGDCYISRSIIKLRDNAPASRDVMLTQKGAVSDPEEGYHISDNGGVDSSFVLNASGEFDEYPAGSGRYRYVGPGNGTHSLDAPSSDIDQYIQFKNKKVGGYVNYHEYMDIWLESEVNGQHVARREMVYPSGVKRRDYVGDSGLRIIANQYPETSAENLYNPVEEYRYHFGYSLQNVLRRFVALPEQAYRQTQFPVRLIYTRKRIENTLVEGFDEIPPNNFFNDIEGELGAITKVINQGADRVVVVQERGASQALFGRVRSVDPNNQAQELSSPGIVIASANITSHENGTRFMRTVQRHGTTVYYFDDRNLMVCRVGQGVEPLSEGKIKALLENNNYDNFQLPIERFANNSYLTGWVESPEHRYGVWNNADVVRFVLQKPDYEGAGPQQGVRYDARVQGFDSRLVVQPVTSDIDGFPNTRVEFVARLYADGKEYDIGNLWVKSPNSDDPQLCKGNGLVMLPNPFSETFFLGERLSELTVLANQPIDYRKAFHQVKLLGEGLSLADTSCVITTERGDNSGAVSLDKERDSTWLFETPIRDASTARRLRGLFATVRVLFSSSTATVRKVITVFKQSHKQL